MLGASRLFCLSAIREGLGDTAINRRFQSMSGELDWTPPSERGTWRRYLSWKKQQDYSMAARHLFLATLLYFHSKELAGSKDLENELGEYYDEIKKI